MHQLRVEKEKGQESAQLLEDDIASSNMFENSVKTSTTTKTNMT